MSSTTSQTEAVATKRGGFVKLSGIIIAIIGAIMFVGGASTWVLIQNQLSAENIVVAEDASSFAGSKVNGPFTAYAQAEIINKHALEASGGPEARDAAWAPNVSMAVMAMEYASSPVDTAQLQMLQGPLGCCANHAASNSK